MLESVLVSVLESVPLSVPVSVSVSELESSVPKSTLESVFVSVLLMLSLDDVSVLSQEDNTSIITNDKTRQMSNVIFPFVLVILTLLKLCFNNIKVLYFKIKKSTNRS